jgi:hypothetical protein
MIRFQRRSRPMEELDRSPSERRCPVQICRSRAGGSRPRRSRFALLPYHGARYGRNPQGARRGSGACRAAGPRTRSIEDVRGRGVLAAVVTVLSGAAGAGPRLLTVTLRDAVLRRIDSADCCTSGHSALRPLQLQHPRITISRTDATGRHPVHLHSLLARPYPRGGEIDDHRVPIAAVHIVRRLTIEGRMGRGLIVRSRVELDEGP